MAATEQQEKTEIILTHQDNRYLENLLMFKKEDNFIINTIPPKIKPIYIYLHQLHSGSFSLPAFTPENFYRQLWIVNSLFKIVSALTGKGTYNRWSNESCRESKIRHATKTALISASQ